MEFAAILIVQNFLIINLCTSLHDLYEVGGLVDNHHDRSELNVSEKKQPLIVSTPQSLRIYTDALKGLGGG